MKLKQAMERVPGGLMVVPLLLGALLNTLDQAHLPVIERLLRALGAEPTADGHYELLRIGHFTTALFKNGATPLIALFLFCAASQMDLRMGGRALKKGVLLTASKYLIGLAVGWLWGRFSDPFHGFLGLSTLAIVAAMTNSNGGLYCALTDLYGNRSDLGAITVLSLNDGPFLTLVGLGLMGANFPWIVFVAVALPIVLGMLAGNLDPEIREFLKPGEKIIIPFFAFALGAGMSFTVFFQHAVALGGLTLGVMTTLLTGLGGILALRLGGERSQVAGIAEGSTAGNAVATPAAVAAAAAGAAKLGMMPAAEAEQFRQIVQIATAQVSVATLTTAVLCPLLTVWWHRRQLAHGIDSRQEDLR